MRVLAGGSTPTSVTASDRAIQFTPPGTQGSIHFGKPSQGDQDRPRACSGGLRHPGCARRPAEARCPGERGIPFRQGSRSLRGTGRRSCAGPWSYGSYAVFNDPDGNGWLLQEVTTRFPGRVAGDTTYPSANDWLGASARGGRPWRAREAHRAEPRGLAELYASTWWRSRRPGAAGVKSVAVSALALVLRAGTSR